MIFFHLVSADHRYRQSRSLSSGLRCASQTFQSVFCFKLKELHNYPKRKFSMHAEICFAASLILQWGSHLVLLWYVSVVTVKARLAY